MLTDYLYIYIININIIIYMMMTTGYTCIYTIIRYYTILYVYVYNNSVYTELWWIKQIRDLTWDLVNQCKSNVSFVLNDILLRVPCCFMLAHFVPECATLAWGSDPWKTWFVVCVDPIELCVKNILNTSYKKAKKNIMTLHWIAFGAPAVAQSMDLDGLETSSCTSA